jgi:G-protein alpha subunit
MGCGSSTPEASPGGQEQKASTQRRTASDDPAEFTKSSGIDRELDRARQQEELKVKLLLLGAGESGKSTIFKQMRILHGSPRTEDDLRMYGVVVRSNIITAIRKLCQLLRTLEMEDQLSQEPPSDSEDNMTPKQAYDDLVAHLVDNTAAPMEKVPNGGGEDWVGHSPRAGLGPNNDAQQFLQLWKPIKVLWEVRSNLL